MINLYFVGTAGSGKSQLTAAFKAWMVNQGLDAITINLDPGAEGIPYTPEIDVREWISLPEVMDRYGLGPNGAQIVCADMLAIKAPDIKEIMDEFDSDYAIVDTPGQVELFAYRNASKAIIDTFGRKNSILAYLFDPFLSKEPSGFVSLFMLAASIQFRIGLPFMGILSKSDMLESDRLEKIVQWSRDFNALYDDLLSSPSSMQLQNSIEIFKAMEVLDTQSELIPTSSENGTGMDDIYNTVQQIFFGGEDIRDDRQPDE